MTDARRIDMHARERRTRLLLELGEALAGQRVRSENEDPCGDAGWEEGRIQSVTPALIDGEAVLQIAWDSGHVTSTPESLLTDESLDWAIESALRAREGES